MAECDASDDNIVDIFRLLEIDAIPNEDYVLERTECPDLEKSTQVVHTDKSIVILRSTETPGFICVQLDTDANKFIPLPESDNIAAPFFYITDNLIVAYDNVRAMLIAWSTKDPTTIVHTGIVEFELDNGELVSPCINNILVVNDELVWLITAMPNETTDIFFYNLTTKTCALESHPVNQIQTITLDAFDAIVWIVSKSGIFYVNMQLSVIIMCPAFRFNELFDLDKRVLTQQRLFYSGISLWETWPKDKQHDWLREYRKCEFTDINHNIIQVIADQTHVICIHNSGFTSYNSATNEMHCCDPHCTIVDAVFIPNSSTFMYHTNTTLVLVDVNPDGTFPATPYPILSKGKSGETRLCDDLRFSQRSIMIDGNTVCVHTFNNYYSTFKIVLGAKTPAIGN